jgi:hypothetical protein
MYRDNRLHIQLLEPLFRAILCVELIDVRPFLLAVTN